MLTPPLPSELPSSSKEGGLAKHLLNCHLQEVCLAAGKVKERKRERRERREKIKAKLKQKQFIYKSSKRKELTNHQKLVFTTYPPLLITKYEGYL